MFDDSVERTMCSRIVTKELSLRCLLYVSAPEVSSQLVIVSPLFSPSACAAYVECAMHIKTMIAVPHKIRLPDELMQMVIEMAWKDIMTKDDRREFYHSLSSASRCLHRTLVHVSSRHLFLRFDQSNTDLELCKLIAAHCQRPPLAQAHAGAAHRTPISSLGCSSPYWRSLLSRAHVNLDLTLLVADADDFFEEGRPSVSYLSLPSPRKTYDTSMQNRKARADRWSAYLHGLRTVLLAGADCPVKSVTTYSAYRLHPSDTIWPLRLFANLFPALESLYLTHGHEPEQACECLHLLLPPPGGGLRSLRYLRLAEYSPACNHLCPGWEKEDCTAHDEMCPVGSLSVRVVPNLRHLHLESPVLLKTLGLPRTLETLTLDAPLMVRYVRDEKTGEKKSVVHYSTLVGYNLPSALRRGLLQHAGESSVRRQVVVCAGEDDPYGLLSAKNTCEEYGIELRKDVVFRHTPIHN
ncbi:hypothetical protein C8Q74DRAFT_497509 [Fomes fomentarius]|nr:hypothetical protein C8Q74DRAFT_497509 [Fomes fomentarius]